MKYRMLDNRADKPQAMINRRQHERFTPAENYLLKLCVHDLTFQVRPDDISRGGAFLCPGVFFPVGAELEVELYGEKGPVKLSARVVRREQEGIAIAFIGTDTSITDFSAGLLKPIRGQ